MDQIYYSHCSEGREVRRKSFFSRGGKLLIAYLCLDYIFPLILNFFFDIDTSFSLLLDKPSVFTSLLLVILVYFFSVFLASLTPSVKTSNNFPIKPLSKKFLFFFYGICFFAGLYVVLQGLSQWRYDDQGLLERGYLAVLIAVIQELLPAVSFWVLITDHNFFLSKKVNDIFLKILISLSLLLSINGLGLAMVTLFFISIFISPSLSLALLFKKNEGAGSRIFRLKNITLLFLIFLMATSLFVLGLMSKRGQDTENIKDSFGIYFSPDYLIDRHSVHLSITSSSLNEEPTIYTKIVSFESIFFRVKLLLGFDAIKPEVGSLSRLAVEKYANFDITNYPRMGASPGFIASFTMLFPLPLASIFLFIAVFCTVKLIDFLLVRQPNFSWIGAFCFAYFPFRSILDSPFDVIVPGPTLIVLCFIFVLSLRKESL